MLAFALIFVLTAHSALAKPTGNCIFMCEAQPGGSSGAYTQPGYGGASGAYTQQGYGGASGAYPQPGYSGFNGAYPQPGYGQAATGFGSPSFGYQPRSGRIEDFGTVPVRPQPAHNEVVQQQIPVQPEIHGLFTHSSSKSSYEANNGFVQIHQPAVSRTVISEPLRQAPMMQSRPARICQDYYNPCY